jgi:hypothetical protein
VTEALNQAVNDGLIQRNAAAKVDPPEIQPRTLNAYTPEEARKLLDVCEATVSKPCLPLP